MSAEESSAAVESAAPSENSRQNIYLVKERFEINFDTSLPEFDTNGGKAFAASDKISPQRRLFALICNNDFPPRLSILPYLKSIDNPHLLKLVEYDIVDYIPEGSRNIALIYSQPTGPRADDFLPDAAPISPETFKKFLSSLTTASENLRANNITHRAIRPDNLFYKNESRTELVLGDCAASFPALFQPVEFETVESSLCLPQGRGNGTNANDIYAIGVTLLSLYLQKDISQDISTPELIRSKLKKGSYQTLSGNNKIAPLVSTVLRGLLNDNPEARWSFTQIYKFMEHNEASFSTPDTIEVSPRALIINGEKLYTARDVAIALQNNPDEALTLFRSGKLLDWIKNGLDNEKLHAKIEKQLDNLNEDNSGFDAVLASICIMLDNNLPIKNGDIYLYPDGIPKAIFHYLRNDFSLKDFYAIFNSDLVRLWYQEQNSLRAPSNFSEFKNYLNNKSYGYGIDRIMYDFDEDIPCTSPLIGKDFVNTPSRLLRSLNRNYSNMKDATPYDRNIIAYLRCKMGKKIDGIITDLNSNQESLQSNAILRLYSTIQNKNGPASLPNLTLWLVNLAKPIIKSYHNLKYQKYLEHELVKTARTGKIIDLYTMLEDDDARRKDNDNYTKAAKEAYALNRERNRLLNERGKIEEEYRELALRFTALLGIIAMVAAFVSNLIRLLS